jgi:Integrase zinc binding domain
MDDQRDNEHSSRRDDWPGGHLGRRRSAFAIQSRAYWLTSSSDLNGFIRECVPCSRQHRGSIRRRAELGDRLRHGAGEDGYCFRSGAAPCDEEMANGRIFRCSSVLATDETEMGPLDGGAYRTTQRPNDGALQEGITSDFL